MVGFGGESSVYDECHSETQGDRSGAWNAQSAFRAEVGLRTMAGRRAGGRKKRDEGRPMVGFNGEYSVLLRFALA